MLAHRLVAAMADAAASLARKGGPKYYAVRCGAQPGVYRTWSECQQQVRRDAEAGSACSCLTDLVKTRALSPGERLLWRRAQSLPHPGGRPGV